MGNLFKIKGFPSYISVVFLNAFLDLGHKITIQNTVFKTYEGDALIFLTAIVNALILLPFILMFTPSGFLADKYPKNRIMQYSALAAVVLTLLITLFYYLGWFWPAFAMTFLLAVQSAFYSPAKYGYIREMAGKDKLATANGMVQATTTISILAGTLIFSIFFEGLLTDVTFNNEQDILQAIAPIGWCLVMLALVELFFASGVVKTQDVDKSMVFDWKKYRSAHYLKQNLSTIKSREVIILSILGLGIFWAIGQVLLAAFPAFAKDTMGITDTRVIQGMLACAGIGIMAGSIIAGKVSKNHIETGLIPVGSLGVAICLFILPQLTSVSMHGLNIFFLGMLGGMFIIPLNALIQYHAGEQILGRVLAGNNLIQNIIMLSFLVLTVLFSIMEISHYLFSLLMFVAVLGALYTVYRLPQSLVRFIFSLAIGQRYRLEVLGFHNIPESGGVLMLGNHISWIDWAIIQIACPRPVRFVMEKTIYQRWYIRRFVDFFGVIPISSGASKSALKSISDLINNGEVVCLFPEGTISRSGQLNTFQHGYEKAAAGSDGIILPFYLRGLWGTWFSRSSDKLKAQRGTGIKRDIIVAFAKPLPMNTSADVLKQKIFDLSVSSWQLHTESFESLGESFIETVKRMPAEPAIVDSGNDPISYKKLLVACIVFSKLIRKLSSENNIGLLLPTSAAGAITNMACLISGKTVVNLNYTAHIDALCSAIDKAEIQTIYTSKKFLNKLEKRGIDLNKVLTMCPVYYLEDLSRMTGNTTQLFHLFVVSILPAHLLKRIYCRHIHLDTTAAILFSSGSEGEPKGIMLSHRNFMANLKQISDVLNTQSSDVVMSTLPLFHAFGLTVTTFMPLIEGVPMVCHPDPADAVNVAKAVSKFKATIFCATSTFLRLYTRNQRVHPLMFDSLRIVVAGAEKLNPEVREAFKLKFNKDIFEGYGATETTPVASVNIPDHLDTVHWRVQTGSKTGTVGMPLPGTSIRIVNPRTMQEMPIGEDGLILIEGSQVMLGYLKDQARTDETIAHLDGHRWYKTGDKGHIDQDGFLTIVDRYARFAKIAGEMISLGAVEEQIRKVVPEPDLEIVAINIPDEKKGERIELLSSHNIQCDDLRKDLLNIHTNPLMIPSTVHVVESIPKSGSGKTDFTASRQLVMSM